MKYGKRLVLFSLFAMNLVDQPAPEVTIAQGVLSGKVSTDGSYLEYIGVPYATANVSNRFQAPFPPPSWTGVYKAIEEYSCPQPSPIGVIGVEDCLKLNVYVPAMAPRPLPVMVWIHGGAFFLGSGGKLMYGPDFLIKHDVIIVTVNYRIGALGFLCLGIKEAPGNAGLKDQVAALRWVQKNIAAFGGDPDNVTIFGESAGGTSVSLLLASKLARGLYNRAIVQSGSAIANWAINYKPVESASIAAKALGYDIDDPKELYKLFSKLTVNELVEKKTERPLGSYLETELLNLPCVENSIPDVEPLLSDLPYNLLKQNPVDVPVIYGSTSKEGLFIAAHENTESIEKRNDQYMFSTDLEFESDAEAKVNSERIKKFYFNDKSISMQMFMNISDLYTHLYFEMPVLLEAELLNSNNNKIYNYYFDYAGGRNFLKHRMGFANETGACHGDDIMYFFNAIVWPYRIKEDDRKIIDLLTKMWTNFAKYGVPTPSSDSDLPVKWTPSSKDNMQLLYIDKELSMGAVPNPSAFKLWKDIYSKYRRKNAPSY